MVWGQILDPNVDQDTIPRLLESSLQWLSIGVIKTWWFHCEMIRYWSIPISHLCLRFTNTNHKFAITRCRFCPLGLKTRSKSQNLQFPSIREITYTGFVICDWQSQITNPGLYIRRNRFCF
jgi:hypothetical protein